MHAEPTTHPTADELAAYSLGKLTEADTLAMARHLETCADCRRAAGNVAPDTFVGLIQAARVALPAATPAPVAVPSRLGASTSMWSEPVPQADPDLDLPPELANHSRFRILSVLGRGGMGTVYLAEHRLMKKLLAVKVINKSLLEHAEALPRFHREVQTAAQLDHPNIVRAHDAERAGDLHMLVMEYVEGLDLSKVLERKGPLPVAHSCHYVRQAALGLQHAFDKKMVHRDIKPQNLMLIPNKGVVKILDFGLARLASERQRGKGLTAQNAVMGTPEYMAPEQATDARTADIRADIYSLGCTLYTLLTGRTPFTEATAVKMILAHLDQEATPLHELRPEVSRELSAVVAKMMAKEPGQRYQTPKEVAEALAPFCKPREKTKVPGSETPRVAASRTEALGVVPVAVPAAQTASAPEADDPAAAFAGLAVPGEAFATARRAHSKDGLRFGLPRWVWLAAAGASAALITLAIILSLRTKYGIIEIELSNPAAKVEISVDGETVKITGVGKPLTVKLKPGEHTWHVSGEGFETDTNSFTVKEGNNPVLHIKLRPIPPPPNPPDPSPNLLVNGSFEEGPDLGQDFTTLQKGATAIRGWEVSRGQIDYLGNKWPPAHGRWSLDLQGSANSSGGVKQAFNTTKGQRYRVTFSMAGNPEGGPARKTLVVEAAGQQKEFSFDITGKGPDNMGWETKTWEFMAVENKTALEFYANMTELTGHGPALDNVSVVAIVGPPVKEQPGLVATFFEGCDLDWKIKTAIHEQINFDWGEDAPDREVPKDLFSIRWEGFIKAPKPGRYKLIAECDDGIRAWLDGRLIIDRWDLHVPKPHTTEVELTGALQPIRVDYFEQAGKAGIRLRWEKLGDGLPPQLVPKAALSHTQEVLKKAQEPQRVLAAQVVPVTPARLPGCAVHSLAFSPKGDIVVSGHSDSKVRLWDVQTGKELHCFEGHTASLNTVAFSPDGRYVLSAGDDKVIRLWDVTSRKFIRQMQGHTGKITCVTFSPVDGRIALSASSWLTKGEKILADDNTLRIWDVERGVELACIRDFKQPVMWVAFFADGRRFVCGGFDEGIRLYDTSDTKTPIRTFPSYGRVIVSPDGQRLMSVDPFSGPSDIIRLWDVSNNKEPVRLFHKHGHCVIEKMGFSPDGRYILSGGWDKKVRLWNFQTGQELCRFEPHEDLVQSIAFSPDGRKVASGGLDGTLRLWALPKELWVFKNLEEALKEPERVRVLDLSNQRLGQLSTEIRRLVNLQELDASNNQLTTIPDEIGWLKQIRTLNVGSNQLTSLPKELGWLFDLRSVDLSNNRLAVLDGHPFTLKSEIHTLNVSGNQLTSLPNELGWLSSLRSLDVSNNQLAALNGHPFTGKEWLRKLNVSENKLESLPPEIGWLINLREFDASSNRLAALHDKIGELRSLERFDLSDNPLPPQELEKVRKLLPKARVIFGTKTPARDAPKNLQPNPAAGARAAVVSKKEITNSIGMKLVRIPAGKFLMGSPQDEAERQADEVRHEVEITKPFHMGVFEVTQEEYQKVMGNNPSWFSRAGGVPGAGEGKGRLQQDKITDTLRFPVENVTWHEAKEFCERLSALPEERRAKRVYDLPTEAQWEYACRAGTTTTFCFGNSLSSTQANFNGNNPFGAGANGPNLERTTTVGSYKPNTFGLYDMHGNVWEWCRDWYGPYDNAIRRDPQGPQFGEHRVLRGGYYGDNGARCRAAFRFNRPPGERNRPRGFRVVYIAGLGDMP